MGKDKYRIRRMYGKNKKSVKKVTCKGERYHHK